MIYIDNQIRSQVLAAGRGRMNGYVITDYDTR